MVSLVKGQKLSLEKSVGLSKVFMGLAWDVRTLKKEVKTGGFFGFGQKTQVVEEKQSVDLDASCVVLDRNGRLLDTVWFRQLQSRDGSIVHSGDNRSGDAAGDDERINVDLGRLPAEAHAMVFVINSFTGQSFNEIENATARLVDATTNKELARYTLTGGGSHTAQIMVRLYRDGGTWQLHAVGQSANGKTFQDLMPQIQSL